MEKRTFRNNEGTASRKLDLRKEAIRVANLTVDTIKQMEAELHKANNLTPYHTHFDKVYVGVIDGHLFIFSNYEFQQYLTVFSILEEVALCDTPCPCAVVAVAMALSKSAHPSKEDMQLLHKRTSEQILEVLTEQASE